LGGKAPPVSEPALHVSYETIADTVVARVTGEVDMRNAPELRSQLETACAKARPLQTVVVDLTGVSFLGSAGLSVLLDIHERCHLRRTPLAVVATTPGVLRPIEMTGLDRVLHVVDSLDHVTRSA
jgi:anti-sigma B factor antagonist